MKGGGLNVLFSGSSDGLDCVKSRIEDHIENPDKCAWGIKVQEEEEQQAGRSILFAPLSFVGKLEGIQL